MENKKSIIWLIVFFLTLSHHHTAESGPTISARVDEPNKPIGKREFISRNLDAVRRMCWSKSDVVIQLDGRNILCQHGPIVRSETQDYLSRKYSIAYINSPGGDISHAMTLGREIFRNGVYAIIDQHCHSACGSYLLPSPRRIYITENTVMSMHTATPRTARDFIFAKYPAEARAALEGKPGGKSLIAMFSEYDGFYRDFVIREMDFFKLLVRDVAYVQRYREVVRTLSRRDSYNCKPNGGLYLIIGDKYLEEFGIRSISTWFPENKEEYVRLLPAASRNNALIYDFDDHPFWMPEIGLVKPEYCITSTSHVDAPK